MAYAVLMEDIPAGSRSEMDGMLDEPYLDELPAGLLRERERARRRAREMGIDQKGALAAMRLPTV